MSDQAATFTIADTLRRLANPAEDTAAALQAAQLDILQRVGTSLPAEFAHPFYWAPFALIGPAVQPSRAATPVAAIGTDSRPSRL